MEENLIVRERRPRHRRRWQDLSHRQRTTLVVSSIVQFTLAGAAWWDLARRPASGVRGPKWSWALLIGINFVGPLSYFRWGRAPVVVE